MSRTPPPPASPSPALPAPAITPRRLDSSTATDPFVAASSLPFAAPAFAPASWRVDTALTASNAEPAFACGSEHLLHDAEIHPIRIALTHAFIERRPLRATVGGAIPHQPQDVRFFPGISI